MNWKDIKNIIKKELKESKNVLNEGLVCGPHKCGLGQACKHQCTPAPANNQCDNCNYGCYNFQCVGGYNVTNDTATKIKKSDRPKNVKLDRSKTIKLDQTKIVALLPMKAHSERIPNKNFKKLNGKPLFRWVLDSLIEIESIDLSGSIFISIYL